MSQTSLRQMPSLTEGQVVNCNPKDITNRSAAVELPFGRLVSKDANGEFILGNTAPVGVTVKSLVQALQRDGSATVYPAGSALGANVMRKGYIAVLVLDGCIDGNDVFVSDTTGEFRATTDTGFTQLVGATFESNAAAGGLASVRIDL